MSLRQTGYLRRNTRVLRTGFITIAAYILIAQICLGQTFTSSIQGTITDPAGALVSGAKVELQNMNKDVHNFTSLPSGTYQFNNLAPGTYQLTVTTPGFKTSLRENLILQAQTASTVDIALQLGSTEQKVEVTGSSVLLDTQTANNATTLDSRLMEALPNATRNPLNFVFALAGTTEAPGGQTQRNGTLDQMSSNFGLNGGRTGNEQILIDGAPSQAVDWGGLIVAPLQDSIQEQQVVVNSYDAQYERAGGGIVTLVTKGGSNQFHGEAYDYLQNSALNANSWYNNRNGFPKGQFKQNQFGGNVGGPILKRANLYFFAGYEGLRQPNTQSTLLTVPTQAERSGDFSQTFNSQGTLATIYNPFSTVMASDGSGNFTRQPFPNNVIPANLINPVGQKIVNLFPLPNQTGQGPEHINNYSKQGSANFENDKIDARIDWEQNATHRIFLRVSDRIRQDQIVSCFFCNGGDQNNNQTNDGVQAVLNDTITPSPNWVINAFVSYSHWREAHTAVGYGQGNASTIGLSPSLFQANLLPTIGLDNEYGGSGLGNGSFQRYVRYSDTAQVNLVKQFSKHTLKFGANYDVGMLNIIQDQAGNLNFSSGLTSCDPANGGPCVAQNQSSILTGSSIASALLGTGSSGGQGINIDPSISLHTYGTYVQDQWHVTSRFTVNAGVRYENQRPATERFNRLDYFDPTIVNPVSSQVAPLLGRPVVGAFEYASSKNRYAWSPNNRDFAPRVGLAYRITDKLVARAGFGIFFLQPSAFIGYDNPGQFLGFSASTGYNATVDNGYTPANLVSNPFPGGINQPTGSASGLFTLVGDGQSQIWLKGHHPDGYTEQWSASLQYQLGSHSVVEASYTGNRGKKLLYGNPNLDLDQLPDQYLKLGANVLDAQVPNPFFGKANANTYLNTTPTIAYNELLRPYPQYTYLVLTRSYPGARSAFDALNVKYNHSFSGGLSLLTTYQWSKALDNGPEDYFGWATGNQWRDATNTKLDYNISTHDVPQSFGTALVYELPYGKGKKWGGSAPGLVQQTVGNWQVSTVIRLASGLPLPAVQAGGNNHLNQYGFQGPQLPDLVGNPRPSNQGPNNEINPNAFTVPTNILALGNEPQRTTQLRERAARNVDIAAAKYFGPERLRAQFRGEFLNAFNYAQYNSVCTDLSESSCFPFGVAQGTENSPRTIQVSLKFIF